MYLEEKSIVCITFNVCLICRASIKLRVCLSFMSWRKQSGFYLRERHFKDLSICYQVKLNNQPLNAVCSRCSNIFHLHMTGSMWACGKETDLLIFTLKQCYAFRLDGWVSSRCIYQGVASIYGEPKWSLYFALGLSSQVHMNELSTVDVLEKGSCIWIFENITPTSLPTNSNY